MNLHQIVESLVELIDDGAEVLITGEHQSWRIELRHPSAHVGRTAALEDLAGSLESAIEAFRTIAKAKGAQS